MMFLLAYIAAPPTIGLAAKPAPALSTRAVTAAVTKRVMSVSPDPGTAFGAAGGVRGAAEKSFGGGWRKIAAAAWPLRLWVARGRGWLWTKRRSKACSAAAPSATAPASGRSTISLRRNCSASPCVSLPIAATRKRRPRRRSCGSGRGLAAFAPTAAAGRAGSSRSPATPPSTAFACAAPRCATSPTWSTSPTPARRPEASAAASDDRRRIEGCLGALPEDRARAVRAAYVEGHTYEELARTFAVPLNTMRTWLRRALIALRKCLEP